MPVIETSGAVRQEPHLLEGPQGGEVGSVKASFRELADLFGPDDYVEEAPPAWVIRVDSPDDSRPSERVMLYARGTGPRQDPEASSWWGLGATSSGRWAAHRVAETVALHRRPAETRCQTCGQLLVATTPEGRSDPVYNHPGQGADHPVVPVTTHPETRGPAGFYVTMRRDRRTAFLLGPHDTYDQAAERVPLGRRLATQADPRSAFDLFGVTHVVVEPGGQLPPGKLNDLPEREPSVAAYHHQVPAHQQPPGPGAEQPEAGMLRGDGRRSGTRLPQQPGHRVPRRLARNPSPEPGQ